jgi:hypothetical protein
MSTMRGFVGKKTVEFLLRRRSHRPEECDDATIEGTADPLVVNSLREQPHSDRGERQPYVLTVAPAEVSDRLY